MMGLSYEGDGRARVQLGWDYGYYWLGGRGSYWPRQVWLGMMTLRVGRNQ